MKLLLFIRFNHDFKCNLKFQLPQAKLFLVVFIVHTRRSTAADIIVSGLSLLINNNNIMFKLNIINIYTYIIR